MSRSAIDALDHAYLIRGEKRRGATWYELAHDRLVQPVRRDNAQWFQENLSLLQRQAEIWEKENRPEHLLLREQVLVDGQAWASQHAGEMTEDEQAFLQESLEADRREREAREAKRRYERSLRQRLVFATVAALVAFILGAVAVSFGYQSRAQSLQIATLALDNATSAARAVTAAVVALDSAKSAERNLYVAETQEALAAKARQTAEAASTQAYQKATEVVAAQSTAQANADQALEAYSAQIAAQGQQVLDRDPGLAALLGVEAMRIQDTFAARDLLLASLEASQERKVSLTAPVIQADQSGHSIPVTNLALSPNGEDLAWGLGSGLVQIYNLTEKSVTRTLNSTGKSAVTALAFSQQPPYQFIAIADARGLLYIHDLASDIEAENKRFIHYFTLRDLAFNPQKPWLAIVTTRYVNIEDVPKLWETYDADGSAVQQFYQAAAINNIAWSPDGRYLATASSDRIVRVWDTQNKELKVVGELNGGVSSVAWSPDGKLLAAASLVAQLSDIKVDDRQIVVWSFPDGAEIKAFNAHGFYKANSLSFSPDGHVLASAGDEGAVVFTETGQWTEIGKYQFTYTGIKPARRDDVEVLAFFPTPGLSLLAAAQYGGQVALLSANPVQSMAYDVVTDLKGASNFTGEVIGLDVRPDQSLSAVIYDKEVAAVSVLKAPSLQQARQGKQVETGANIPFRASVAAFSPDHSRLALGGESEPVISAYDPETGSEIFSQTIADADPSSPVYGLAFSNDGSQLAALLCSAKPQAGVCDKDHKFVQVLDAASGEPGVLAGFSYSLKGLDKPLNLYREGKPNITLLLPFDVNWTAFTRGPEDAWYASADEATLYLWDAGREAQMGLPLTGSPAEITSLAYNPRDGLLYTGLSNGSIQAWSMFPEEWIREACLAANPKVLSSTNWEKYFPGQEFRPTCTDQ